MRMGLTLAVVLTLGGCSSRPVEQSDFVGRWTWEGQDCSRANLEIAPDAIYMTALSGERGRMFNVLPGPSGTMERTEYVMHLETLPHRSMHLDMQRDLMSGGGRHALLLKLEGNTIKPLMMAADGGGMELTPDHQAYQLFNVTRCA